MERTDARCYEVHREGEREHNSIETSRNPILPMGFLILNQVIAIHIVIGVQKFMRKSCGPFISLQSARGLA
jgi:hypothetical protein